MDKQYIYIVSVQGKLERVQKTSIDLTCLRMESLASTVRRKMKLDPSIKIRLTLRENDDYILIDDDEDVSHIQSGRKVYVDILSDSGSLIKKAKDTTIVYWVFERSQRKNLGSRYFLRDNTPPKLVRCKSNPHPRICELPAEAKTVKIQVKGFSPDENNEILYGNVSIPNGDGEADFPDFQVLKSSYNATTGGYENWCLQFIVYGNEDVVEMVIESDPISVVPTLSHLGTSNLSINDVIPNTGEVNVSHKVVLLGEFSKSPNIKVCVDGEYKQYEFYNDNTLIVYDMISKNPGRVDIVVSCGREQESKTVCFMYTHPCI